MEEIEEFLASHPYADETIRTYRNVLSKTLAKDAAGMTANDLVKLLKSSGWGNKRQCVALAATQKYLAWKYGHSHPALQAKIKRLETQPQNTIDADTALRLLASFNPHSPTGARNLALCSLDLDTGLRASELCRLLLRDTNLARCKLDVLVKGGKWKTALFTEDTAAYIDRWLSFRKAAPGVDNLFVSHWTGEALTAPGLRSIIKDWGKKIGIDLSPHALRRSMACIATELMNAPERILMEMGRWEHPSMIKTYTKAIRLEAVRKYLPMKGLKRLQSEKEGRE